MAPYLPDELLLQIFTHLLSWEDAHRLDFEKVDEDGLKTLANLCISSKRLRFIAEPILYSIYVKPIHLCDREDHSPSLCPIVHIPNVSLRHFIRTLIERPDLAALVKFVQLRAWETERTLGEELWSFEQARFDVTSIPPSTELAQKFWDAASELAPAEKPPKDLLIALCRGDEDAEIALLLSLLPNVEKLQITFPNVPMDGYEFFFLHDITQKSSLRPDIKQGPRLRTLQKLKQLEVRSFWTDDGDLGLPIYPFSAFFCLPELEVFKGRNMLVESDPEEWGEWSCPQGHSSIRDLHLEDSLISSAAIATLVASCKDLRSLNVSFSRDSNDALEFQYFELSEALKRHQHSLSSLSIDIHDDSNLLVEPQENMAMPFGSLKEYTMLRKLKVNEFALVGLPPPGQEDEFMQKCDLANVLPASLESLTILDPIKRAGSPLVALSRSLSFFPVLRKLRIEIGQASNPRRTDMEQDFIEHIGRLFKAHGVVFEVSFQSDESWEELGRSRTPSQSPPFVLA